jgi:acetyl esterase/lipase
MRKGLLGAAALLAVAADAQVAVKLPSTMSVKGVQALPAAEPAETLRTGDAPSQIVELFLPRERGEATLPVVVMIHGGCWQKNVAGPELMRPAAGALVAKGFAVWSVGYRRADEEGGGYPGTYRDVAAAIDLLAAEAEARKLDLRRVAFYGHSAGGHLALWGAYRAKLPKESPLAAEASLKPRGVVAVGALANLKDDAWVIKGICGIDPAQSLVNPEAADPYADTSPAAMIAADVPVVMLHGVYDGIAFPELGLSFAHAVRRAGGGAEVVLAPNAGHFEVIAPGTRAFEQAAAALERFTK